MKKYFYCIALILMLTIRAQAGDLKNFIDNAVQHDCVVHQSLKGEELSTQLNSSGFFEQSMESFDLVVIENNCAKEQRAELMDMLDSLQKSNSSDKHEVLMNVSDEGDLVLLVGEREKAGLINTLYMIVVDDEDKNIVFMVMKGDFSDDTIHSFIDGQINKKK